MVNKPIVILCTVPDVECARNIAAILIEEKLAACCNIIQGLLSIYKWQGALKEDNELLLIIKSTAEKFSLLESRITKLHPYDTPEIIGTEFNYSNDKYLQWIIESIR